MTKFNSIDNILYDKNKIILKSKNTFDKLILKSKKFSLDFKIEKNIIDLEKLSKYLESLIEANKMFLVKKNIYEIYLIENERVSEALEVMGIYNSEETYIAKNIYIEYGSSKYIFDLFISKNKTLNIVINRIDSKMENLILDYKNIYISGTKLSINVEVSKEKLNKYNPNKSSIILYGKDSSEIFEFDSLKINDNNIFFEIDINDVASIKSGTLNVLIKVDNYINSIKLGTEIEFKNIKLQCDELVYASVRVEDELFIEIVSEFICRAILTEVIDNNGLVIKGIINCEYNIFLNEKIKGKLKFISNDGKIFTEYLADIYNENFEVKLSDKDMKEIKDLSIEPWISNFVVYNNEKIISEYTLLNAKKNKNDKRKNILTGTINYNDQAINYKVAIKKESDNIEFIISNDITVLKVMSVVVKKNSLKFRCRTQENIEKSFNDKFKTTVSISDMDLKQSKIKRVGKKTFIATYNTPKAREIASNIHKSGVTVSIVSNYGKSVSYISDIDKDTIFYTFLQRAQASKKYKQIVRSIYKNVLNKLPIKNNQIVYESFLGRNMSDSPKYIYEYLQKEYKGKYKHIWVFNDIRDDLPRDIKQVKRFSFTHLYYVATSKFWVNNMRQPTWFIRREEQEFLATWHGTPLKKLVFDMDEVHSANKNYKEDFYKQSRVWDYLISANPYSSEIFKRAFKFDNTLLELGYPRNDLLYAENKDEIAIGLRKKLGIPLDKKVILYAPTWRDDQFFKPGKYKFDLELDLRRLRKELGNDYYLVLRTHYFIANHIDVEGLEDFVYNASSYDDITELYLITDVLITDYSSVFFDYANLNRPTLFFTYDLEKYRDTLRGFYLDLQTEGPGPIVMNNDEIINELKDYNKLCKKYNDRINSFHNRFCTWDDGYAAKRIAERVIVKSSNSNTIK